MTSVFGTTIIGAGHAGRSLAERLTKGGMTVHRRKPDRVTNSSRAHAASHTTSACLAANEFLVISCWIATSPKNRKRLRRTRPATLRAT
jgi:3-hydroxyisobutyrate dehydrogenase-like beta-hydroxyacid dehydrogenase